MTAPKASRSEFLAAGLRTRHVRRRVMRLGGFPKLALASLRIALITAAEKMCDFPTPRERRTPVVIIQLARLKLARLLLWLAGLRWLV